MQFSIWLLFQKVFQFTAEIHQRQNQHIYIFSYLIIFTFPFPFQKDPAAFFQRTADFSAFAFYQAANLQKSLFAKTCTVHFPSAFHQIVCLIDQKQIISFYIVTEKTLQSRIRVKYIIIVTDHGIHPHRKIQRHLIGANFPFFALFPDGFPVKHLGLIQHFKNCFVHPVIMPFRIRTFDRIAFCLFQRTDLFFCRQRQYFIAKPFAF